MVAVFLGTHFPKLDDKGRVILPAKFRDELATGMVITKGQEHCLYVFTQRQFETIHERIRQAPVNNKSARDFLRVFLSGANQDVPDAQGRVTLPAGLREYAGLDRDLTVIGVGDRAEIWDTAAWNDYSGSAEQEFADVQEEVIPGLF